MRKRTYQIWEITRIVPDLWRSTVSHPLVLMQRSLFPNHFIRLYHQGKVSGFILRCAIRALVHGVKVMTTTLPISMATPLGANPRQDLGDDVPPNTNKRWTINMTAPTSPDTYRTQWMIKHGDNTFGPNMFIDVTVELSDTTAPSGHVTAPTDGAMINHNSFTVWAEASDNPGGSGVSRVEFYLWPNGASDWIHIGTDSNGSDGWSASWDAGGYPDGNVYTDIGVTDGAGNSWRGGGTSFILDRTPPTGHATAPVEGDIFNHNNLSLWFAPEDDLTGIQKVEFLRLATWIY